MFVICGIYVFLGDSVMLVSVIFGVYIYNEMFYDEMFKLFEEQDVDMVNLMSEVYVVMKRDELCNVVVFFGVSDVCFMDFLEFFWLNDYLLVKEWLKDVIFDVWFYVLIIQSLYLSGYYRFMNTICDDYVEIVLVV